MPNFQKFLHYAYGKILDITPIVGANDYGHHKATQHPFAVYWNTLSIALKKSSKNSHCFKLALTHFSAFSYRVNDTSFGLTLSEL